MSQSKLVIGYDKLTIVTAFLDYPNIYGFSEKWKSIGKGSLKNKIDRVSKEMENDGQLWVDLEGTAHIDNHLLEIGKTIGSPDLQGSIISNMSEIYFYLKDKKVVIQEKLSNVTCEVQMVMVDELNKEHFIHDEVNFLAMMILKESEGVYKSVYDEAFYELDGLDINKLIENFIKKIKEVA